jgi:hypothetical protein
MIGKIKFFLWAKIYSLLLRKDSCAGEISSPFINTIYLKIHIWFKFSKEMVTWGTPWSEYNIAFDWITWTISQYEITFSTPQSISLTAFTWLTILQLKLNLSWKDFQFHWSSICGRNKNQVTQSPWALRTLRNSEI